MSDEEREGDGIEETRAVEKTAERSGRTTEAFSPSVVPTAILEMNSVFTALSSSRRRYLCYSLLEDTEWSLSELSARIAAWEGSDTAADEEDRRAVYISLYHEHVPVLVEQNVVTYDEESGTITAARNARQVLRALEGLGASLDARQETHARQTDNRKRDGERREFDRSTDDVSETPTGRRTSDADEAETDRRTDDAADGVGDEETGGGV